MNCIIFTFFFKYLEFYINKSETLSVKINKIFKKVEKFK